MSYLLLIAVALAMDSVAVSIASGSKYKTITFSTTFLIAFIFGFFQGLMPLIGYLGGSIFNEYVREYDHWIAFILLVFLGGKMFYEAYKNEFEEEVQDLAVKTLLLLAVATSIDALAVGVTFSFMEIDILQAVLIIGAVTMLLCVGAVYIGKALGSLLEDKAEMLGGAILIFLGCKILFEHLGIV